MVAETLARTTQQEMAKQTTKVVAKNFATKAAGGALISVCVKYGCSIGGTAWRCGRGQNSAMNEAKQRCAERLEAGARSKQKLVNAADLTATFCKEAWKDKPPFTRVAGGATGGAVGSIISAAALVQASAQPSAA